MVSSFQRPAKGPPLVWVIRAIWGFGGLVLLSGLAVVVRALFADRSKGRRRCPKCWYEMTGVSGLRCPECGREARAERSLLRTRRRPARAALGVVLALLSLIVWRVPGAIEHGWWSVTPTPVLVVILQFWDDDTVFQRVQARMATGNKALSSWEKLLVARHCGKVLSKPDTAVTTSASKVYIPAPSPQGDGNQEDPAVATTPPSGGWTMFTPYGPMQAHDEAFNLLRQLGPAARPALPALIAALGTPSERDQALSTIASIGPSARRAISPINALLNDDNANHHLIFQTLIALAASTNESLSAAERIVRSPASLSTKLAAVNFINRTFPLPKALSSLESLLACDDTTGRIAAARGLEHLGPAAVTSIPALVRATRDRRHSLEAVGADVLRSFGAAGVPALAELALDANPEVARPAAAILGVLGAAARPAVPALIKALRHPDPFVPPHAANSLSRIGSPEALAALDDLARDTTAPGSPEAARALNQLRTVPGG